MTPANYIAIAALLVSLVMMVVNTYNITKSQSRAEQTNKEKDEQKVKEETAQQTGIMLALDNIKNTLSRIENEINTVRQDTKENHDKLIVMEQSFKSEHKRLDDHEKRLTSIEEQLRKE